MHRRHGHDSIDAKTFFSSTPDSRFTLLPVACLGACDQAPAMMVDEELYGNLTPQRIEEALEKYR